MRRSGEGHSGQREGQVQRPWGGNRVGVLGGLYGWVREVGRG